MPAAATTFPVRRLVVPITLLLLAAFAPAARAADVVGIADQSAGMFSNPFFEQLDVRVSRLIVSYDAVLRGTFEVADIDNWMSEARRTDVEPLIAFGHSRGCYDGARGRIVRLERCRLPSVARYRQAVSRFRRRYPDVRVYTPWNEVNHLSQPTANAPKRAAEFYGVVRRSCARCRVLAADILDQPGMARYLRSFRRHVEGSPRLWGLHNYQDTNDFTTSGTRRMLRLVPGEIWLTETGGIVRFGRRPYSLSRAARATRFMFGLAASNRRITRLYIYNWTGVSRDERFDAGLTTPGGRPRPAYYVVRRQLRRRGGNPRPRVRAVG